MKRRLLLSLAALLLPCRPVPAADFAAIRAEAEKLYAEGSYQLAREAYERGGALKLPPADERWLRFRLADTLWRSQAASATADTTKFDAARQELDALVRDIQRPEDRDPVWTEVQESLGDFYWTRRDTRDWGSSWQRYQAALDAWAGAPDIEAARSRYLGIVRKAARPAWAEPHYFYGSYGNRLPLDVAENAAKIATSEEDKAYTQYLLAVTLMERGDWRGGERVEKAFEAAIAPGAKTEWYDDALYQYAQWLSQQGKVVYDENGQPRREQDFVRALELYRRILKAFEKGETRFHDDAGNQVESITRREASVQASNTFLPESEIDLLIAWRNVKQIELTLYRVSLPRDLRLAEQDDRAWLEHVDLGAADKVKVISKETGDKGDYKPGTLQIRLDEKLPVGAYVAEIRGGEKPGREIVLVTDAALVLKAVNDKALLYFCNALDGSPVADAKLRLWENYSDGNRWSWRSYDAVSGSNGLALIKMQTGDRGRQQLLAVAAFGERQAYSGGYSSSSGSREPSWRIYAFTDRPAYRPEDAVKWKLIARRHDGSTYSTPESAKLLYEITDPQGAKIKEETIALNAFGSAWGEVALGTNLPLGVYTMAFWEESRGRHLGSSPLFRLEEYKLPEFKVTVSTPEEDGRRKTFLPGDRIEASIEAEYYFGGPVANASVEVVVYQKPFYRFWWEPREFPWFYEDMQPRYRDYGGEGSIVKRETIKTDKDGNAVLAFESPQGGQDLEFRIEARVTDASRREITGNGSVRVTRQRYYVDLQPEHNIYKPQDQVTVAIHAADPNDRPVEAEGTIRVTREWWHEVWVRPGGGEVFGPALLKLQAESRIWPPPPVKPGGPAWRLKSRGIERDEIVKRTVRTDTEGAAEFTFTPEREGYYQVSWTSKQEGGPPIAAGATAWVATRDTSDLGFRQGGLQIVVDKDTFREGQNAAVMLSVPTSGSYVLFSVEGEDLYSHELIHVQGTVKLIQLPITAAHVPNIFLSGLLVSDANVYSDTKQVVVPPEKHFVTLSVEPDRKEYQPREDSTWTITSVDHEGKPVAAEIAFGLSDESVLYIQSDFAGDIRQYYYGDKRGQAVQTQSTFNQKSYAKIVPATEPPPVPQPLGYEVAVLNELWESGASDADLNRPLVMKGLYSAPSSGGRAMDMRRYGGKMALAKSEVTAGAMPMMDVALSAPMGTSMEKEDVGGMGGKGAAEIIVRSDFRATAFWQPDVTTDGSGKAKVTAQLPDSLTSWKATARAITAGDQFGITGATVRTRQPLIVRLQAPRFFVIGDTVTVSAVLNNNTDAPMTTTPSIEADGLVLKSSAASVLVPANGETRVDWTASVEKPGDVRIKVSARSGNLGDAMEKTYIAHDHGIEKFLAVSGKVRGNDTTLKIDLPRERRAGSTEMSVQIAPSMAVTMLDALPYLADYPYGCTEQTMSRFLPAVITAKTLKDLGLPPEAVAGKLFGGIEPAHTGKTHPKPKADLAKLDDMVKAGLDRLYDFQHGDGGWGWWKEGESDHFMTAYVVWGMTLAREAGVSVSGALERGAEFLDKEIVEREDQPDMQAWMLHALASHHRISKRSGIGKLQQRALDNLWAKRDELNAYTRALLALAARDYGQTDKAQTLVRNLANGVKRDDAPDISIVMRNDSAPDTRHSALATAHWGEDGIYWRWSDGDVEATAFALKALLAVDPRHDLVEPVMNWLVKNRRGAQWSSTRDTAICLLSLNDYLRASGELAPDLEYELIVNGTSVAKRKVTSAEALTAPSRFDIDSALVRDGANEIRVVRQGTEGALYLSASAKFFSLEEPITPAGSEIFVRRQYYKNVGRPTLLKGYVYDREPLSDGESVTSGDRIDCVITIEGKNNYEYLVFEDLKPAGFEAVAVRSGESLHVRELKSGAAAAHLKEDAAVQSSIGRGESGDDYTGRQRWVYQELRDRKTALFIDRLPEGVWEIRYELRAEAPGTFHALPVLGHAMYVPEIRCNGAEVRITVEDRAP